MSTWRKKGGSFGFNKTGDRGRGVIIKHSVHSCIGLGSDAGKETGRGKKERIVLQGRTFKHNDPCVV